MFLGLIDYLNLGLNLLPDWVYNCAIKFKCTNIIYVPKPRSQKALIATATDKTASEIFKKNALVTV